MTRRIIAATAAAFLLASPVVAFAADAPADSSAPAPKKHKSHHKAKAAPAAPATDAATPAK